MEVKVNAKEIYQFNSFNDWVNKANRVLGDIDTDEETLMCIDKNGNACNLGRQWMFARDNDLFPVTAYILIKNTDIEIKKQT